MSEQHNEAEHVQEENRLIAERRAKLSAIREKRNAFPNHFRREDYADRLQAELGEKGKDELEALDRQASIAGRIMAKRGPFMVLQDMSGRIQVYVDKKQFPEELADEIKTWDIGDIISATGPVHKSGKGDLYVYMKETSLLTKSLRPLPDKFHGLQDQEIRYRQRYVDLIMNESSRRTFAIRSKMISSIRNFLQQRDFVEVETPMMQVIPGGASARPFVTHHNALSMDMYLRIAPELYLKRLVVGGIERVFEINRNFRNEGLSTRHNPEFTMIEFYQAYADYKDMMDLTEAMLRNTAQEVLGTTTINYQGSEYDLAQPFTRLSVFDSVLQFNADISAAQLADMAQASAIAKKLGVDVKDSWGLGKIQIEIFEETVEHKLDQPTFITEYPTEVSPLARRNDDNPFVTDRFEFFVGGRELANGFSELNDSEDQAERFMAQVSEKDGGDDEAMHYDADYIAALEYGLPPTAGEGIGIDRLVMLFTDAPSIRDVLLFPHMRPE
ncbi:lysine--tRNA ligase [Zhongshania arctica]|mgnify:FL=1|uniref:Lysine--tRNA ligase n=1 Tax=Zhongshania arctica TaxID=3238302 RepID=A0ABV3TY07_9GAMM|tara:strand:- start:2003 stop:3499 length:1497 start_codon:yes stop_codon:yes gene_type:complete